MFLTDLFNFKKRCNHEKITPDMECGYCPDCGCFVQNEWYITRCACCGVKLKTAIIKDEIVPQNHYCTNCGNDTYIVEKLEKINFIDINFAVLKKIVTKSVQNLPMTTQCWEERNILQPKLPILSL